MKFVNLFIAIAAALAILSASPAIAQNKPSKGKSKDVAMDQAQQATDRVEMERDSLSGPGKKSREQIEGAMDDHDSNDDDYHSDDDDMDGDGPPSDIARDKSSKGRDKAMKGKDNAAKRGNEKSQEMRARRDERKAIKEEYKAEKKMGDGEADMDTDALESEVDDALESDTKKEKKPWWKFWNR